MKCYWLPLLRWVFRFKLEKFQISWTRLDTSLLTHNNFSYLTPFISLTPRGHSHFGLYQYTRSFLEITRWACISYSRHSFYVCLETIIELARMLMVNPEPGFSGSGFLFHLESQGFSHCWLKLFELWWWDWLFITLMFRPSSYLFSMATELSMLWQKPEV